MSDVAFVLNGAAVSVESGGTLLDALREQLGVISVKDGCSPQGQCGCCTVWVDGQARASCVTPVARVKGRAITTIEGLESGRAWADRFAECGASQCGFCTPGIIMRLAALTDERRHDPAQIEKSLLAHLCRCTGWQPITVAATGFTGIETNVTPDERAARRAELEGGVPQTVGRVVALGQGGFADDTAPSDALVALLDGSGQWVVGADLVDARAKSGKVQGRRTTAPLTWPIEVPAGEWARTLRTTWVEPAYLEPDASWCEPGGEPMSSHGNGGAFGGKTTGELGDVARRLADQHGHPVRVLYTREDVVRRGAKRPPLAAGIRGDGTGSVRIANTAGLDPADQMFAGFDVELVDVVGPPTSMTLRAAVAAELAALRASLQPGPKYRVALDNGSVATADYRDDTLAVTVRCGTPLDATVLQSYCIGAAHMALGLVTAEGLSVGNDGVPHDLTIRSFGVLRAVDTPPVEVTIEPDDGPPVNGSDAVFAAVAAAVWADTDFAPNWPTNAGP